MAKIVKIDYDPYNNHFCFKISQDDGESWQDIGETSSLLKYQNQECVFSNCVEDIIEQIDTYHNTGSRGVLIHFCGTDSDFELLERITALVNSNSRRQGGISCHHVATYLSANNAIVIIRNAYKRISNEFADYLPNRVNTESIDENKIRIGETISTFNSTISKDIPICVIGTYSVGKSAFINALIGDDILPSEVNPSTAKTVKVTNSSVYSITIEYQSSPVRLTFRNGVLDESDSSQTDNLARIISENIVFDSPKDAVILNKILNLLNADPSKHLFLNEIGCNVSVELPFISSGLNQDDARVVFCDTPGSNNSNIDQQEHRKSLESLMQGQTNALPVFVMDRESVSSNDNNSVKKLLDDNIKGFSTPYCLIVLSKAERLTNNALKQSIPPAIQNWHGKTTILHICSVGALGIKKNNSNWIDIDYQDSYKNWKRKYVDEGLCLPKYNLIPCGRSMDESIKSKVNDELFASGIPSVENEINYYILHYANYKKCVNGRELLLYAMKMAEDRLKSQNDTLSKEKEKQEKDRTKKRTSLIDALDKVVIPTIPVSDISEKYNSVLSKYCQDIPVAVESGWAKAKTTNSPKENLDQYMQKHCNENLFLPAYEGENGIERIILQILMQNANKYKQKIQRVVEEKESDLSSEAQIELNDIFGAIPEPSFSKVSVKDSWLLRKLVDISFFEDMYKRSYARNFEKQLSYHEEGVFTKTLYIGVFAEHCIQNPIRKYFSQLKQWSIKQLELIKTTLNKDNSILSHHDKTISNLEDQIADLKRRMSNLVDVKEHLKKVLDLSEVISNE